MTAYMDQGKGEKEGDWRGGRWRRHRGHRGTVERHCLCDR